MDRCAVLVDAGYLLGGAATLLTGDPDRSRLDVEHSRLIKALIAEAEERTGLPVLRVLWYDAAPEGRPQAEHRVLRVLPDVKVRLGDLVRRGARFQQKGVDSFLQRDLTTLARNRAVADVVLLGGDEDLRRGVEEAQDFGTRIHLWGVEAAAPEYNQSEALIGESDRRWVIPANWIQSYVGLRPEVAASLPDLSTVISAHAITAQQLASVGELPAPGASASAWDHGAFANTRPRTATTGAPDSGTTHGADVGVQAGMGQAGVDYAQGDAGHELDSTSPANIASRFVGARRPAWQERRPFPPVALPCLRDLTTPSQAWTDNEEDAAAGISDPVAIGGRFGVRWRARASVEDLTVLRSQDPMLPRTLDGELLRYADRMGLDTWEDEGGKLAVRGGFWRVIRIIIPDELDDFEEVAEVEAAEGEAPAPAKKTTKKAAAAAQPPAVATAPGGPVADGIPTGPFGVSGELTPEAALAAVLGKAEKAAAEAKAIADAEAMAEAKARAKANAEAAAAAAAEAEAAAVAEAAAEAAEAEVAASESASDAEDEPGDEAEEVEAPEAETPEAEGKES